MAGEELIWPKLVELARLDTAATAFPAGRSRLGELKVTNANDGSARDSGRREMAETVKILAQIETDREDEGQAPVAIGDAPVSRVRLVLDYNDVAALGLIDPTTKALLIKRGDRLVAAYDPTTQALITTYDNPPGMFVYHRPKLAFGFDEGGPPRLVLLELESRMPTGS